MTMIGIGPVFDMMRKEAAKQRAREDDAYEKERRRLRLECTACDGSGEGVADTVWKACDGTGSGY